MAKASVRWLGVGVILVWSGANASSARGDEVVKDPKGRVVSRRTRNPDESGHVTTFRYTTDSVRPQWVVDEDVDPKGHVTKKIEQRFDGQGRVEEKVEVTIDASGQETGTRTRYGRDASGRVSTEVTPLK